VHDADRLALLDHEQCRNARRVDQLQRGGSKHLRRRRLGLTRHDVGGAGFHEIAAHLAPQVADVTAKTLRKNLVTMASRKSELHTDDALTYYWLGREFAKHSAVNHSAGE
jgi:hypothetical protein